MKHNIAKYIVVVVAVVLMSASVSANKGVKSERVSPDNTAINARDKSIFEPTADQHTTRKEDVRITQSIRKNIMKDTSLSVYAKNIKIITDLGHVTLKGPVENADEKRTLETIARKVAGDEAVINDIDVVKTAR